MVSPSLRAELIHPNCKQWERADLLRGTGKQLVGLPCVNKVGWPGTEEEFFGHSQEMELHC